MGADPLVPSTPESPTVVRYPKKDLVCFNSSFAYESAPNITHMTLDGERTACGRTEWATTEGWHANGPDCLRCRKAWDRLPEIERRSPWDDDPERDHEHGYGGRAANVGGED